MKKLPSVNPTMPILARTRQASTCQSCGAAIEWAKHPRTGKFMPFNAPIVIADYSQAMDGSEIAHVDMAATTSHFATCPHAARWRK